MESRRLFAATYAVTDLGTLPGDGSGANGVNASGQVVGSFAAAADEYHAFLYNDGVMSDLGTLGGADSNATGINDSEQVVGWSNDSAGDNHAFLYSDGVMSDLGTLGGTDSEANGINESGQVVGYSSDSAGDQHAFLYSDGGMSDLGTLGGTSSKAYDINNSGQVVGDSYDSAGDYHAFLYSDGIMSDLGTFPGSPDSVATGINAGGQVVGYSYVAATNEYHAFLYSDGVMSDLGTLSGGTVSYACGINDNGEVVGYSSDSAGDEHAFLYSDGVMQDLNNLIPSNSGWVLVNATGINANGQICGYGAAPGGQIDAFLLTPSPTVTGISPTTGPSTGGTSVTINGANFSGATAVDFGTAPATSFTVNSAGTQITAVDPVGSGTVDVTVVTPSGTSATSSADQFTYVNTPPSWLAAGSQATWNPSTSTLTVTGPATITADPGSDDPNVVASVSAAKLTIAPTTGDVDIHIGGVTLTNGASIVMSDVDASDVADGTNASNHHADHNVLVIGTLGAVNDPTISIDSSSKLDLGDNDLIVHTGSSDIGATDVQGYMETNELKAIEALAAEGRNVAPGGIYNGTWTGDGLTSSAAATADNDTDYERNILAVEQNSDMYLGGYSSWTVGSATEKLGANDIIVKYTYNGDLNLDGAVDGNAATIFSTFYDNGATSGNIYAYGDLNDDGEINGNDATIFSTMYGNGLAGSGLPQL